MMHKKSHLHFFYSWTGFAAKKNSVRVLGLSVENAWATWAAVIASLIYFLLSQYPDLSVWDSSLIALAAIQGGLGHPPGYPLHTLLGSLVTQLPGIAPLTGVKLLSAIPGALICIPILCLAGQMRTHGSSAKTPLGSWLAAALIFFLCIHPVLWDSATRVEVYFLAAFLATWGVARIAMSLHEDAALSESFEKKSPNGFFIAGLALGASASVNPVVAATTAMAAFCALMKSTFQKGGTGWRGIAKLVAGGLTGLLPYAWLPLVAGRSDRLVWGAPTTPGSLWDFLAAKDFAKNVGPDATALFSHLFDWVGWSTVTGTLFFIAIGIIGWILIGKRSALGRSAPLALVLVVFAICNNKVWVPENPDYLGYLSAPLAICYAGGIAMLMRLFDLGGRRNRFLFWGCLLSIAMVTLMASPALYSRTRHNDRTARIIAQGAFDEAPRDGIIVLNSDHWFWPMLYLQEIEKKRPDVVLIPIGLAGTKWYWNHIYRLHPTLNPFPTQGEGGKYGKVGRFLKANSDRHVSVENTRVALLTGVEFEDVGWLLLENQASNPNKGKINQTIERAAALIRGGSPDGGGTLSLVSYFRGEALWRLGRPAEAYRSLLSGVPPTIRPIMNPTAERWETIPTTRPLFPPNASIRGLGNPHLNIQMAAHLAGYQQDQISTDTDRKTPNDTQQLPDAPN